MPIPGTTSIAHIRENLDAQDVELSREDIQSINNFAPEGTATKALPLTPARSSLQGPIEGRGKRGNRDGQ
jgi:diketogulonate reductase-like aldo/keto reductase